MRSMLVVPLVGVLTACQVRSVNTRSSGLQGADTTASTTSIQVAEAPSFAFGVLDPKVNFSPNNNDSANTMATRFPIREGDSEVALLHDGPDYLAARWMMLEQAKVSVRLQSLVFHGDESGWKIARKLVALKEKGIRIRVIVDSISNIYAVDQAMFLYLQQNGIKVEGYDIMYLYLLQEINRSFTIDSLVDKANMRYHEKMMIIDAEDPKTAMAVVGGVNIANKYFRIDRSQQEENWRDRDVLARGQVAIDMANSFDENLKETESFRANSALFNTTPLWTLANQIRDVLKIPPVLPTREPELNEDLKKKVDLAAMTPLQLEWKPVRTRFLKSRPRKQEPYIHYAHLEAIKDSQKSIKIMNAYFVPTADLREALKNAARRGVAVEILVNDVQVADYPTVMKSARLLYADLLSVNRESGVKGSLKIYEWGGDPVFKNGYGLHHGKYAIFDGSLQFVGSFNLDPRSRNLNSESMLIYENLELGQDLVADFDAEKAPGLATEITYEKALSFKDSDGLLKFLENKFLEALQPIL